MVAARRQRGRRDREADARTPQPYGHRSCQEQPAPVGVSPRPCAQRSRGYASTRGCWLRVTRPRVHQDQPLSSRLEARTSPLPASSCGQVSPSASRLNRAAEPRPPSPRKARQGLVSCPQSGRLVLTGRRWCAGRERLIHSNFRSERGCQPTAGGVSFAHEFEQCAGPSGVG